MHMTRYYFLLFSHVFIDLITFRTRCNSPSCNSNIFLVNAFNIDEEYPIVISDKFDHDNAHFGASVILLPSLNRQHYPKSRVENGVTGWVLVGAPKANSTNTNHTDIDEPGVIWRCSLGQLEDTENDKICQIVGMDPTGVYDPYDKKNPYRDRKDGGWLGGSIFVGDSERFVACASRWINQKFRDLYLLNGMCYWLPKDHLQRIVESESEDDWPSLAPDLSYRLCPLLNKTKQTYTMQPPNKDVQQNKTKIHDWSYGQFGFSLHLTAKNELIAGAIGMLDWTGSIVYYRDSSEPRPQFRRYNALHNSSVFSEVLVARTQEHLSFLESSDYFGYSVTSGHFFNSTISNNRTQFAGGAPRSSRLSGKVIIFSLRELEGTRSEATVELLTEPLEGRETNKGNHYGSYFGHSLLALDVNGDGYDDLLVGAPLYGTNLRLKRNAFIPNFFAEQGDTNENLEETQRVTLKSGDEGCVFVYSSSGDDFIRTPQAICGDKISGARFGMAISSLRDVNYDGYNDIAIGAPYENEGRGAVYIYHGGEQFVSLAQKLQPESIDTKIRTFGWSLGLGVDIDENSYPDLAVGAYETNQVVIYRTIPIIHFRPKLIASISKLLPTISEFNLTTCLQYSGVGKMPNVLEIYVKLTVEVEPEGRRLVALVHENDDSISKRSSVILNVTESLPNQLPPPALLRHRQLMLSSIQLLTFHHNDLFCYNFTAVAVGNIDGLTRTVPIRLEYWMSGHEQDVVGDVKPIFYEITRNYSGPGITVNLANSKSNFSDFNRRLPMPAGNTFGTETLNIPVGTICEGDGNPECLANLTISARLLDLEHKTVHDIHNPFVLGSTEILTLEVEVFNHRETANLPVILYLQWQQPPTIRREPPNCEDPSKKSSSKNGQHVYVCFIRRPIKEGQKESVAVELDMSSVYGASKQRHLNVFIDANTSSLLVDEPKFNLSIPLRTKVKPQNFHHESFITEYSAGNSSTFGISQAFEISLQGPSTAAKVLVEFDIPFQVTLNGNDYDLIAIREPIVTYDGEMTCTAETGKFLEHVYNLTLNENHTGRSNNSHHLINDGDSHFTHVKRVTRSLFGSFSTYTNERTPNQPQIEDTGTILKVQCNGSSGKNPSRVKCFRVKCIASHFAPSKKAVVEFKLKLINNVADLLLDSDNYDEEISFLWIESVGTVRTLDSEGNPFGSVGSLNFTSRLKIPPPYDLPAWILIVSVAGGLLLFTFLTMLLKKCGFFRRSKRDELLLRLRAEAFGRRRFPVSNPSTLSTARARTSSSQRRRLQNTHNNQHTVSSSGSAGGSRRKRSFRRTREEVEFATGSSVSISLSTSDSCSSPSTVAKQKEIPGAVDLNELRRLYAYADQNELY